ncbi:cupin domain-containing protein [Anaeroselena agilis]|uniref:Cupin domain-containing protein n=1 Tax=Anaeroselena agilis TaxID=3063788 RepID=A0ABU3P4J4_9FIRM|nr:cupin domain-containing protein [Selenomonadales bacterium 4137-cl]
MKKGLILTLACMLLIAGSALAAPGPVVGDAKLLDTSFDKGVVISLDAFFAEHPLKAGDATRGDTVFKSPRVEVVLVTNRGPLIDLHYHATCEETVFVYKGQGEMFIDGKWTPVKTGDLHVNPRGAIHATRVTGDEDMNVVCFFTAPQASGNDKAFIPNPGKYEGTGIGAPTLLDTQFTKNFVLNLDQFYAEHPLKPGEATRGDTVFKSPRAEIVLVTNHGPLIGRHYHSSAEEIVYIHKGQGEMYIGGEWVPVKGGDLHINPRGIYHSTRVTGEDLNVFCIFAPPQAGGNDKTFLDK